MPDSESQKRLAPRRVPVTAAHLSALSAEHGVPAEPFEPIESIGIINSVYLLGQGFVLRVPRDHDGHVAQAHREAAAIPAAVDAGVRTPRLVAFDDSLEILPVPYLIVERVPGTNAESMGVVPPDPLDSWRAVGADIARLHSSPAAPPPGEPCPLERRDPRALVDLRAREGWISTLEARRLHAWLDRLAPLVAPRPVVFVHGDLQMSNVLLHPETGRYQALIDWGCAHAGDPADDVGVVPLGAVDAMLEGYRQVAPAGKGLTEAAVLWRRVQRVLSILPRGAAPGWAWGERPVAGLTDMLLFFQTPAAGRGDSPWRDLAPELDRAGGRAARPAGASP